MTRIVVADHHIIVREGLTRLLSERSGFEVVGQAGDGEEAIDAVIRNKPDVVIMDVDMPRVSGIDATRRIMTHGFNTRIIMLSSHDERKFVEQALRAGAAGYLVKTCCVDELAAAVTSVQTGACYLSPEVTKQVVDAIAHPAATGRSAVAMLTGREREVIQLIAEGMSSKEIAIMLGVSLKTIDSHRSNLMEKINIHKASGLVRWAIRMGLVEA